MIPRLVVRGMAIAPKCVVNKSSVTGIIARCVTHTDICIHVYVYVCR